METYYGLTKEQAMTKAKIVASTEARAKALATKIKAEKTRAMAKARADKIKQLKSFRMPKVGDLLYHIPTGRLVYCDGYNYKGHVIMSFPGEDTPREYAKSEITSNFKY